MLPPERVRAQLAAQRGGADVVFDGRGRRVGGARLLAVVTLRPGETGRHYRLATERDYEAVGKAQARLAEMLGEWERGGRKGLCPVPDEPVNPVRPSPNARGLSAVTRYGMASFADLYCSRQLVTLHALALLVRRHARGPEGRLLALLVGKQSDYSSAQVTWVPSGEFVAHAFHRQALSMTWDFAECAPLADAAGGLVGSLDWICRVVEASAAVGGGQVEQADASAHPLPDASASAWFTDPPYYDAIPYADIADYFLVWLRRAADHASLGDPFDRGNPLSPKEREIVWNAGHRFRGRPKDRNFFEEAIGESFTEGRRILRSDGVACIVFAHQTTEGWEVMIGGMVRGGWNVGASWPIATERSARTRAIDNASLATSVHLICRPRAEDAGVGDWADVLRELPKRVGDWMERLQAEGVRGADLVFACIGPALEVFSRYTRVETADGREVCLDEYLQKVWEVVGRTALQNVLGTAEARARNGAAGALEEDARLTALFLWTLQATDGEDADDAAGAQEDEHAVDADEEEDASTRGKTKGYTLVFDVVRRFAQPLGVDLGKWEGRVVETRKGIVRLLPVTERARQLFGQDGAEAVAERLERPPRGEAPQLTLFPELQVAPAARGGARGRTGGGARDITDQDLAAPRQSTTLDRVHAAMLLQAGGRTNALRALLRTEVDRGPDFLRLANALSALYPRGSEEKRLLDAMLLAAPR
ncbi:MAG: hypothetical protein AB1505_00075 [Candidatus Latescibacterota bacterium]